MNILELFINTANNIYLTSNHTLFSSLSDMEVGSIKSVVKELYDLGLCSRCILRFIDERDTSLYEGDYEKVSSYVHKRYLDGKSCDENKNGEKKDELPVEDENSSCTACVGILRNLKDTAKQIADAIENSQFEYRSFNLSLTIPLCCLVRQHSISLYLMEKFSTIYADRKTVDSLPSIKEVLKWVCGPALGEVLGVYFEHEGPFQVAVHFAHDNGNEELEFLTDYDPIKFRERKAKRRGPPPVMFSGATVRKALEELGTTDKLRKFTYCPPKLPSYKGFCSQVTCTHAAVLLAGRYNKYSRRLPQTPWLIDGERMLQSSVQEKICDILKTKIKADDYKFSSGGREDVDVCMLGTGRPFVIECINPRKNTFSKEFLSELQQEINSSTSDVAIRDFQVVTKEDYTKLKEAENTKTKTYNCRIWTEQEITKEQLLPLTDIKDLLLKQKTPLRVLHRRPVAVRDKMVHHMSSKWVDNHHFTLDLKTMAGTYVKEFVHGDFGRTKPNLGILLGMKTDILQLDVLSVDVDWPPSLG